MINHGYLLKKMIQFNNLIRKNFILFFYWGAKPLKRYFIRAMNKIMKVVVITNPRQDTYRLYYNQALSYKNHHLEIVNWWNSVNGLFKHPTLPSPSQIFKNFSGRTFKVPVVHKPPWHFVNYLNDSIEVLGGRDDKLLSLLAQYLNFKFLYFDPPDRNQGSSVLENGSFEGVLGLIGKRKAEFFLGDVTLTLERLNVVEFSFITLADSVAFVTHAPSRLNEALALVRPFHWQVWPPIIATLLVSGPILYILIAWSNAWRPRIIIRSHSRLFFDCCWFAITLFFKQTGREPSSSNKCRIFVIILSFSATYIISDMYSANLTSLLAKPGREKSINNLVELEEAMMQRGYKMYVEKLSSSYSLLENGTGLLGRLWKMMTNNQDSYVIDTVEEGVKLVSNSKDIAFVAGRETLYFDIQRFGAKNFHLSEKLNTAYSAIAFQIGCPYIENFNKILISIFEAGILTKMTAEEYGKLEKHKSTDDDSDDSQLTTNEVETTKGGNTLDDNEKLQPISIKMLQGAFYLLFIGCGFSVIIFAFEIAYHRQRYNIKRIKRYLTRRFRRIMRKIRYRYRKLRRAMTRTNNSDAFRIQYSMMRTSGIWPEENSTIIYKIKCIISWTFTLLLLLSMVLEVIYHIRDFEKLSDTLYIMFTMAATVTKMGSFSYEKKTFLKILKLLKDPLFVSYPQHLDHYMAETVKNSIFIANLYRYLVGCCIVMFMVYPLLDNKPLPFPFPFDLGSYTYYMYALQIVGVGIAAWNNSSMDTLTTSIMGITSAQLDILCKKLVHIRDSIRGNHSGLNTELIVINRLKECVKHHNVIIRLVNYTERVFTLGLFAQFGTSVIVICTTVFPIAMASRITTQFTMLLNYLAILMCQLFIYCWYGNEIILKSIQVGEACYQFDWYTVGKSARIYLFIMMERSKRPLIITTMKFSNLSINSYKSILQWCYSGLMLLLKMYREEPEV
ncbi:hypothetical protein FQA39_LY08051 [Lamprigera yunnana]|nr:hypothetical protein FQA39_LY08051 [Lamprigera yunnana]